MLLRRFASAPDSLLGGVAAILLALASSSLRFLQAYFIDILESRQVDHLVDGTVRLEHNNTVALSPFVRLRLDHEEAAL